jgi:Flp pilus assembly pilin Flp
MILWLYTKFSFSDGERGASMVEYALLVVFIAIVALVAVEIGGNEISESYSDISSSLEWAGSK